MGKKPSSSRLEWRLKPMNSQMVERLGFFARHRIKIVMWALVAEMLASPLADSHPRAGALLGSRGAVDGARRHRSLRKPIGRATSGASGGGDLDDHENR